MTDEPSQTNMTPVAVFLYNRPAHAKLALESLSRCRRLDECFLRIYCDAAKRPEDSAPVAETRQVAHEWASRFGWQVIERETNLGLSRSIVSAVSELCDSHGRVIVVEDDLSLNPSFLDYMLLALDRYATEPNVYQISGYMFPIRHAPKPDAFFIPLTTTWGWATWKRAWQIFDWHATGATELLRDPATRRSFNLNNAYPYAEILEATLRGKHDSWGILFWWAVFNVGGLVLHPRKSLVWNGGFDETGTHCGDQTWSNQSFSEVSADTWMPGSFQLPTEVTLDESAFSKIVQFLTSEQSDGGLIARIRRRIMQRRGRKEHRRIYANDGR